MQKKCWIVTLLASLTMLATSCSSLKDRSPASDRDSVLADIYSKVHTASSLIGTSSVACQKTFENLYRDLFNIAGTSAYFDTSDIKAIDEDIQKSFETRIALKESFKRFSLRSNTDLACLNGAQEVFKALRYVEDYLVELRMDKAASAPYEYISMMGNFPYLLVNPKFANDFRSYEDLKSGDVILSRGNAYSSAAIARISQNDYQFSHMSFVYRDPETRDLFTTEARLEIGSIVAPIADHLNEKNMRSVVFRYKDEFVAHKASKYMFDLVKKHQDTGKNIEYDFSMNYKDDSKLYCAEIISRGFKVALADNSYLPKFKSKFPKGVIPFLNTIGVPVTNENINTLDIIAPGDIQFDPNFELVAEWRNPKKLEESRFKDFILTKMFERMEKNGYQIDPSFKMDAEARALWLLRRTPIVKKFLEKKFALNMTPSQLELFMALDKIGDTFYKNLERHSVNFDHPMTPKEIYVVIDDFINKDFEQYKRYKEGQNVSKPLFHLLFHP